MTEVPQRRRWESERRYYCALLHQDLLGDWVLDRVWGGKFNRLGGQDTKLAGNYEAGISMLQDVDKVRLARRYVEVG